MKKLLLRLLLVLVSLLLGVVALDVVVRVFDVAGVSYYRDVQRYLREAIHLPPGQPGELSREGRMFQNRPGVELRLKTFTYATDANGLRCSPGSPAFEPGSADRTILFVGDSVTLAWGVDDEHSWVRLVERDGRVPGGGRLRCLNAGHLMYDTVQEASLIRDWLPALEPDVVVLTFIINDLQPTWGQVLGQLDESQSDRPEELAWRGAGVLDHLYGISTLLRHQFEQRAKDRADPETIPPLSFYPSGWPRCEAALERIAATCAQAGVQLVVNDHTVPEVPELPAWCEARGVPHISTRFTEAEQALDIQNSRIDAHANELGNRLIADKALAGLARVGVLAETPGSASR
jgi:lysophospholipase L1-like esterase